MISWSNMIDMIDSVSFGLSNLSKDTKTRVPKVDPLGTSSQPPWPLQEVHLRCRGECGQDPGGGQWKLWCSRGVKKGSSR